MRKKGFLMTAAALVVAGPAFAFQCPSDVAAIDRALSADTALSEEQRAQVMALRDKGETLHNEGDHAQSVETLAQAKEILGIN